ncbi:MAG: FtsH protease activity modulator HflK [Treponema sp.]|jgi:membrane protease subunit HflK|nr:FtsH protease activity modulator HflK [Treponema sp.]
MEHFTPPKVGKYLNRGMLGLIGGGIFVIVLLATSVYIVDQTEQAVITRSGRAIGTREPGLQFKLPFGIDRNYTVNVKTVQTEEFGFRTLRGVQNQSYQNRTQYASQMGESTMLTGDLNIVEVEWIIQYRIVDPRAWTFNVRERERTATIRDVSRSAINMLVGDRAIMDVMGAERSAIEAAGMDFMNDKFREYELGISVITVKLQNIVPPDGVQQAFEDVNKAIQDMERLINEGQQVYNEEIPKTVGEGSRRIKEAEGYAIERVKRANGDVDRFNSVYDEYRRSPEVTRQRLYYEMIEEVFKNEEGTVIIDRNLRNFLPLMNLQGGNR